jgi:hypothetical protein
MAIAELADRPLARCVVVSKLARDLLERATR